MRCELSLTGIATCILALWSQHYRHLPAQVPLTLVGHYNNKAFGSYPGEASLDTEGNALPADPLTLSGDTYTSASSGLKYDQLGYRKDGYDNVICAGQTVSVHASKGYRVAGMLLTTDVKSNTASGNVTLVYRDGEEQVPVRAQSFWWFGSARRGEINFPYFFTSNDTNHNTSMIYETIFPLDGSRELRAIILPDSTDVVRGRLHLFAMTLWHSDPEGDAGLLVQQLKPTQQEDLSTGHQIVHLTLNQVVRHCLSNVEVSLLEGTVKSHFLKRICPGDQVRVELVVDSSAYRHPSRFAKNEPTFSDHATVKITRGDQTFLHRHAVAPRSSFSLKQYTPTAQDLLQHEPPQWFDQSKFGIFIHWGPYSVPAWGNTPDHESYAEWYWWYSCMSDPSNIREFRSNFSGKANYDEYFKDFTASRWDPKAWVDLINDAGAKYFVFTTKHHDGFATFDAGNTTHRSSLHYGPKRDTLEELFDAARTYQPHLKRGTYFSLPEWFNPAYGKYGYATGAGNAAGSFPGMLARNPFTGEEEPYTGLMPVNDFIDDVMMPQMDILAYKYDSDIMWCDAGAFNGTDRFAANWFNWARDTRHKQVLINDRCGSTWVADIDTPEYATFGQVQQRKWESNRGMDPFSYGYNRGTPSTGYMSALTIVHNLVDIVSKNGNFLLDIGPRADGTIPQVIESHLREAGAWIKTHGEAIFNTTYWFITPEEGSLRFTRNDHSFYILSLVRPSLGKLVLSSPVPVQVGDTVSVINQHGEEEVEWGHDDDGFWINITDRITEADCYCWGFKIAYGP